MTATEQFLAVTLVAAAVVVVGSVIVIGGFTLTAIPLFFL